MKEVLLTIDYEVFLGKETGSVKDCMIEPTEKLISIIKHNNSKMTVFWDILHYYRLLQLENDFPELKEDISLIKKQILELIEKGHDIQLHIHPHWLDAKYENGKWKFKYDRFNIHKLSNEYNRYDINTIIGCITISKKLIEDLTRKANPNHNIIAYRAGGYLVEPFDKIYNALKDTDIYIDSSVCPDFSNNNEIFSFDFKSYPKRIYYRFDTSLKNINEQGKFIEIPIWTVKIPIYRNLIFTAIRKLKYPQLESSRKGEGSGYSTKYGRKSPLKRFLKIVTEPRINQFTTDGNFREKFNYIFKRVPEKSTMILHPKLLNEHTLNLIEEYIDKGKIKFLSIIDLINSIDSSLIKKKESVRINKL